MDQDLNLKEPTWNPLEPSNGFMSFYGDPLLCGREPPQEDNRDSPQNDSKLTQCDRGHPQEYNREPPTHTEKHKEH